MATELSEPLPTQLRLIVLGMCLPVDDIAPGNEREQYAWSEIVAGKRVEILEYLQLAAETATDRRRTIREADRSLAPELVNTPFLLVAFCTRPREVGIMTTLSSGDLLYAVFAPTGLARGLTACRLV